MQSLWLSRLSILGSFLFVLIISLVYFGGFFQLSQVECRVAEQPCPDYLQAELEKSIGQNIFSYDFHEVGRATIHKAPFLTAVKIKKKLPRTVLFEFERAQAAYGLLAPEGRVAIVDQAGVVMEIQEKTELPVATLKPELGDWAQLRYQIERHTHQQLQGMFVVLKEKEISYERVAFVTSEELEILLSDGKRARLSLADAEYQTIRLAALLQSVDFTVFESSAAVIDLRFKYPVIKKDGEKTLDTSG